jgi:aerobic-type carbon monoxide dehydrogenase small subunit (CoxS/CutS family)
VNGVAAEVAADPLTSLRAVLGETLGLRTVREPCGVGACGACTVLIGDRPVKSCLRPVGLVGDAEIQTAEGLAPDDPVVAALAARNAFQCGFCIPGFVMAVYGLLSVDPAPTPDAIRSALAGNLCRCGSYTLIVEAVLDLAARRPADGRASRP